MPERLTLYLLHAQWERKFLAAQLKLDFDDGDREELFLAWNVHRESRERKTQLVKKLWAPDQTRCRTLSCRLSGAAGADLRAAACHHETTLVAQNLRTQCTAR